jgi:hypothetical protein
MCNKMQWFWENQQYDDNSTFKVCAIKVLINPMLLPCQLTVVHLIYNAHIRKIPYMNEMSPQGCICLFFFANEI